MARYAIPGYEVLIVTCEKNRLTQGAAPDFDLTDMSAYWRPDCRLNAKATIGGRDGHLLEMAGA